MPRVLFDPCDGRDIKGVRIEIRTYIPFNGRAYRSLLSARGLPRILFDACDGSQTKSVRINIRTYIPCSIQAPKNSPKDCNDSTRSHSVFIATRIGTAITAPGMPHIQPQNSRESTIMTGFRLRRRPTTMGVTK